MTTKGFFRMVLLSGLTASLAFTSPANSTPLTPGTILSSPPTVFDTLSGNPGTLLNASTATITTSSFTANVRQALFNPGIANTLDYYFQVVNSPSSSDAIGRVTDRSFGGFTTDIFIRTDDAGGGGSAGFTASSTFPVGIDRDISGQTVGWDFPKGERPALAPGSTSEILVVRVNSPDFSANGQFNAIDGAVGSTLSFAPQAPQTTTPSTPSNVVPEPASLILFGTGMAGVAFVVRWRRART
jgi:hypothetical protein